MTENLLLLVGGLGAGFINTLASSGSAIAVPIFLRSGSRSPVCGSFMPNGVLPLTHLELKSQLDVAAFVVDPIAHPVRVYLR
jgi:hypothetical protein